MRFPLLVLLGLVCAGSALGLSTIYNNSFNSQCVGWTNGNCDTAHADYNVSVNGTTITSPSFNESNYTMLIETWRGFLTTNVTNQKWRGIETTSSSNNDDVLGDTAGGLQRWRLEQGFLGTCNNLDFNQWVTYTRNLTRLNSTTATLSFNATNGTVSCAWSVTASVNWTRNSDRNYTRIEAGNFLPGGYFLLTNYTVQVLDAEYNASGPAPNNNTYNLTYPLLNASGPSDFGLANRSADYDELVQGLARSGNVTQSIGNDLWVPWYASSSSCTVNDLQNGGNCNIGMTVDSSHNCMVDDEFSQVGIIASMGNNATLMNRTYQTLLAIRSTHGSLPAWKTWRNGSTIVVCQVTNTNCDTASDGTARLITSLYNAANNTAFANSDRNNYLSLANMMIADMLSNEVVQACEPSHLGLGNICYWLASGSDAKTNGVTSNDFWYTGYEPDAEIAFAQAYSATGNQTYAAVAGNFSIMYLQLSYPNGYNWSISGVRVPGGKAGHWTNFTVDAAPVCDDTCTPLEWDPEDASRALSYCQANYWMRRAQINNTAQETYCRNLGNALFNSTTSTPLQLYPNGTSLAFLSGYQAQGLAALQDMGGNNQSLFGPTLDSALSHYSASNHVWDGEACFGVYNHAFAIRALGEGIGRNLASWPAFVNGTGGGSPPTLTINSLGFAQSPVRSNDDPVCQANTTYVGSAANLSFSYNIYVNGLSVNNGTTTGPANTLVNVSTTDNTFTIRGSNLTCSVTATDGTQTSMPTNATVTVHNALPVLQTAVINPAGNLLNCSSTSTDQDNDTIQASFYNWFVNGTTNVTTQTLNTSGVAQNSTAICQVIVNDGLENSTPLNTSAATIGDNTPPNLSMISIPTIGDITTPLTLSAYCVDDHNLAQGTPTVSWVNPNGITEGNYTLTSTGGGNYQRSFTFNTVGNYHDFTVTCKDANGNTATNQPGTVLTIGLPSSGGGGGSSGNQPSTGPAACGFSILQPVDGYLNAACSPGLQSDQFNVVVYNDQGTTQTYTTNFTNGVTCQVTTPTFSIDPKSSTTVTVTRCDCPPGGANDALQGGMVIQDGACGNTVPVSLYNNAFAHLANDATTLFQIVGAVLGALVGTGLLILLLSKR